MELIDEIEAAKQEYSASKNRQETLTTIADRLYQSPPVEPIENPGSGTATNAPMSADRAHQIAVEVQRSLRRLGDELFTVCGDRRMAKISTDEIGARLIECGKEYYDRRQAERVKSPQAVTNSMA